MTINFLGICFFVFTEIERNWKLNLELDGSVRLFKSIHHAFIVLNKQTLSSSFVSSLFPVNLSLLLMKINFHFLYANHTNKWIYFLHSSISFLETFNLLFLWDSDLIIWWSRNTFRSSQCKYSIIKMDNVQRSIKTTCSSNLWQVILQEIHSIFRKDFDLIKLN